jgi:hypothetical protein
VGRSVRASAGWLQREALNLARWIKLKQKNVVRMQFIMSKRLILRSGGACHNIIVA